MSMTEIDELGVGVELLEALWKRNGKSTSTRWLKSNEVWTDNQMYTRYCKVRDTPFVDVEFRPDSRSGQEMKWFSLTAAGEEAFREYRGESEDVPVDARSEPFEWDRAEYEELMERLDDLDGSGVEGTDVDVEGLEEYVYGWTEYGESYFLALRACVEALGIENFDELLAAHEDGDGDVEPVVSSSGQTAEASSPEERFNRINAKHGK